MKNNLTARTVVIAVTMLICVFGIIGILLILLGRKKKALIGYARD